MLSNLRALSLTVALSKFANASPNFIKKSVKLNNESAWSASLSLDLEVKETSSSIGLDLYDLM